MVRVARLLAVLRSTVRLGRRYRRLGFCRGAGIGAGELQLLLGFCFVVVEFERVGLVPGTGWDESAPGSGGQINAVERVGCSRAGAGNAGEREDGLDPAVDVADQVFLAF
jgi:hypothetical protein